MNILNSWKYYKLAQMSLWIVVGMGLIFKAIYLFSSYLYQGEGSVSPLFSWSQEALGSTAKMYAAFLYVLIACGVGVLKAIYVLGPKITRTPSRDQFSFTSNFVKDSLLIVVMVLIGTTLKFVLPYYDVRGFILLAVGNALILSGVLGFTFARRVA
jgi:hypothetical protein